MCPTSLPFKACIGLRAGEKRPVFEQKPYRYSTTMSLNFLICKKILLVSSTTQMDLSLLEIMPLKTLTQCLSGTLEEHNNWQLLLFLPPSKS